MKYTTLDEFYHMVPEAAKLKHIMDMDDTKTAMGSSHNHQAWVGGYTDHVLETLNIGIWLYVSSPRPMPFPLEDALLVLFLHDIEKPFKNTQTWRDKQERRDFRTMLIQQNQIRLTEEQQNALRYVEGVPDSEYSNKERVMGAMAAFCHMCDIASARLWHDKGATHAW